MVTSLSGALQRAEAPPDLGRSRASPPPSWVERGNVVEGIVVVSREWIYLHVNDAMLRASPRWAERLVGRRLVDCHPGIEATPGFAVMVRCMYEGVSGRFEQPWPDRDGAPRWREFHVEPVREGICLHSVDIQAQKDAERARDVRAERQRLPSCDRLPLEQELRQRAAFIELGEAASALAHEVRNPLSGACGALEVVMRRLPDSPERLVIHQVVRRLASLETLMHGFLALGRTSPGPAADAATDLRAVLATLTQLLASEPAHAGVSVVVRGDAPRAAIAEAALVSVLDNLLRNAVDAMGSSGVIAVELSTDGADCVVHIHDSGPGVPAALHDKIFVPFFTTRCEGTGLGLPIVRRILEDHGGSVTLVADAAPGARFEVRLPRAAP